MMEELKEEAIVNKLGGRFKLSTLIQKRLVALNKGSRALIAEESDQKMSTVLKEILSDKIFLDASNEVRTTGAPSDGLDFDVLSDLDPSMT